MNHRFHYPKVTLLSTGAPGAPLPAPYALAASLSQRDLVKASLLHKPR
jgi:hypothetical protein